MNESSEVKIVEPQENLPMMPEMDQVRLIDDFRTQFTSFLKEKMIDGTDYGVIPGTGNKPTLLLPGAQKLLNYFGFTSETAVSEKVEDHKEGYFFYKYEARIVDQNGKTRSNGFGSANTKENKFSRRPAWDMANTVDKMAQKRSLVSAVLGATRASEFYTQDLEDMAPSDHERSAPNEEHRTSEAAKKPAATKSASSDTQVRVLEIAHKKSKNGNDYRLVTTDAGKMFVWDTEVKVSEGSDYFFDTETKGEYVTIVAAYPAQAIPQGSDGDPGPSDIPF
jgi:hypothetical protein